MIYTIIIDKNDKINIAHTFEYEVDDYKTLPSEYGDYYIFREEEKAIEWIRENVKPEYISDSIMNTKTELRKKYLKD